MGIQHRPTKSTKPKLYTLFGLVIAFAIYLNITFMPSSPMQDDPLVGVLVEDTIVSPPDPQSPLRGGAFEGALKRDDSNTIPIPDPPKPDLSKLPVLPYMDSPTERSYISHIHSLPPVPPSQKYVISFGLYGDNPKYTQGAIRNAELKDTYFPGWTCRFYADDSVPGEIKAKLRSLGSEVLSPPPSLQGGSAGMFWRFLVADDPTVSRFIVRDSDSRLNARDRLAVEEWINSGKCVHVVRDHVNHVRTMNGGLWGGIVGCNGMKKGGGIVNLIKESKWSKMDGYMQDIYLLTDHVWPLIEDDQIGHDAYSCGKYPNSVPFPTKRDDNYQHVGQVFDKDDNPRMGDIDGFIRGKRNPTECRPKEHQDWIYG